MKVYIKERNDPNMIKTKNIIDIINGDINIMSKLKIMIKNATNGEIYPIMNSSVADEILFVCFAEEPKLKPVTCKEFIWDIWYESQNRMWEAIYFKETKLSDSDLETALIDLIVSFPIKIYLGSFCDPQSYVGNKNIVKDILAVEVTVDTLYLLFK